MSPTIKTKLIQNGVKNLNEFGYPDCDESNILTDMIYSRMFLSMLKENLGGAADEEINSLIQQIEAPSK